MDEEYDCIVCGTGLTECVLSGLLSVSGHKVLHVDRNPYYGGESASLNLQQLFQNYGKGEPPAALGKSHLYNVDQVPKFLMADGELVKILRATVVNRYQMEFMLCDGSFVYTGGKVHKVPCTEREALASPLMGIFEKRRAAKFFAWCQDYDAKEPKTWGKLKPMEQTMRQVFDHFGLGKDTIEFVGHALALEESEEYLDRRAHETLMKIQLYESSLSLYEGGCVSPFVYPLYGLGELPQAFARLAAVHGGTYMLQTPVEEVMTNPDGTFQGIRIGADAQPDVAGKSARAKFIVGDPTYFPERCGKVDQVVRTIVLMDHPIEATKTRSCQIIVPSGQCKPPRRHDIYVLQLCDVHKVVPANMYVAIVSTVVETGSPEAELKEGLHLCGKVIESFTSVSDVYAPKDDGRQSRIYISESYDSSSHFENTARNILEMYERITGKPYDFDKGAGDPSQM
eukprot:TRINITY_DN70460_c0_g1_i1.p1 TRINITY_DN70460_c0_g1~~TRINITY_DN70460_c0_g1_i1.p1  ORF type:complete len:484 (+),score=206.56 TRINITY_DN70460_c0_g1_i1:91-1452(+)